MKSVLEEVQSEVKREESKRSDLELCYIKDRCAWQLERVELMSRITQVCSSQSLQNNFIRL